MSKYLKILFKNRWNPGTILSIPEYPRIPRILIQEGVSVLESWEYTRVSQDSEDTFPQGSMAGGILG